MDDIDLDIKIKELEESVKCRRERRREQKKEMQEELEKSVKKEVSRSEDSQLTVSESEKRSAGGGGSRGSQGRLYDEEEKYIRELCETEKRIRQLESTISDLNFELEKIDLAETTGVSVWLLRKKPLELDFGLRLWTSTWIVTVKLLNLETLHHIGSYS